MRIAVIGGTLFIGRAVVEELAAAGHAVTIVHRGEHEPDDLPSVNHVHADRRDTAAVRAGLQEADPEAVIDMRAMVTADAEGLLAAAPAKARLVVISSIDVYEAFAALLANTESEPVPLDESSRLRTARYPFKGAVPGRDDYDKLDVEDLVLPRGATVLRLPMVYGERDYQRREEFILRRVRANRDRIPVGAGTWLPARGYVRDVARAIRLAAESPDVGGEVFNLSDRYTHTNGLWAQMILDAAGSKAQLVRVEDALLPPDLGSTAALKQHIVATPAKAIRRLGWEPGEPAKNLAASVRWHLANPPPAEDPDFSADDAALK